MILSKPSIISMDTIDREATLRKIEAAAKNCYQSKTKEDINDVAKFVAGLVKSGHMSPVELGGMFKGYHQDEQGRYGRDYETQSWSFFLHFLTEVCR